MNFMNPVSKLGVVKILILGTIGLGSLIGVALFKSSQSNPISNVQENDSILFSNMDESIRIATLLPFAADQLIKMGVKPVCVPELRGKKTESWKGIPTVQLDHSGGPNLEQLISVSPDYIITATTYAQFMDRIESITKSKVIYMDINSIENVYEHINTLGEISKNKVKASELVLDIKNKFNSTVENNSESNVNVLAIFGTPHSFYAFLPESFLGDLVEKAGGTMGPEGLVSHKVYRGLAPLTMETVIEYNPDLLLVLFHGNLESSRAMFENDPLWSSLSVVKQNRIHFLDEDRYTMRPGSDLDKAMEEIQYYVQLNPDMK